MIAQVKAVSKSAAHTMYKQNEPCITLLTGLGVEGDIRKAGIMGIVIQGGIVRPGNSIRVQLPEPPFLPLERV